MLSAATRENANTISTRMTYILTELRDALTKRSIEPAEKLEDAICAVKREIGQYFYHSGEVSPQWRQKQVDTYEKMYRLI